MPQYPPGFTAEEYDELKALILDLAQDGSFNANEVLARYITKRMSGGAERYAKNPVNAGSVAQILDDLVDLGELRRLDVEPPRWARPDS